MSAVVLRAVVAGCLFAVGLYLADLEQPAHVLGAFRFGPDWDPRLAAMFLGAHVIQWPVTRLLRRRGKTLRDQPLTFVKRPIDLRFFVGAVIFGVGWGLGGICPGPGVVAAFTGTHALVFMAAFLVALRVVPTGSR